MENNKELKRLYNEKGKEASIHDVIAWFNCYYPEDVFIDHPIAKARNILNNMLKDASKGALQDTLVLNISPAGGFGEARGIQTNNPARASIPVLTDAFTRDRGESGKTKALVKIAVFGPTKGVTTNDKIHFREFMDTIERPVLIVTSTCQGWDAMGRTYAKLNPNVKTKVIKARIRELGYKKAVKTCNREIAELVDFGVTCKDAGTKGTVHMIQTLENMEKRIIEI